MKTINVTVNPDTLLAAAYRLQLDDTTIQVIADDGTPVTLHLHRPSDGQGVDLLRAALCVTGQN